MACHTVTHVCYDLGLSRSYSLEGTESDWKITTTSQTTTETSRCPVMNSVNSASRTELNDWDPGSRSSGSGLEGDDVTSGEDAEEDAEYEGDDDEEDGNGREQEEEEEEEQEEEEEEEETSEESDEFTSSSDVNQNTSNKSEGSDLFVIDRCSSNHSLTSPDGVLAKLVFARGRRYICTRDKEIV